MSFLNPEMKDRTKGIILTLFISFSVIIFFFGPILIKPNSYYFSASGDGMQTYFHALYHTKHDTTLLRQQSVNHPYGESVFFTGCLPSITNTIVLLKPIVDLSDFTSGIINFLILISIPCSAVFIFLILDQWKVNWVYSSFAGAGIALFSPQLDRLGGHLALTFQFAIPAVIYLLNLFYESPDYKKSLLIGLFVFFISSQHLYFFGFSGLIAAVFFLIVSIRKDTRFQPKFLLFFHFTIQIILPYLAIQFLLYFSESPTDRSAFPWGYLIYKANTTSIFYPTRMWYEDWAHSFITPIPYEWEGRAYIGLTGIIASGAAIILLLWNLIRFKKISITSTIFVDIMLLIALAALLYSFGHPFLHNEELLKYSGPLKQMRGVGRFSWIFFYITNMAGFYFLYQWTKNAKPFLRITILSISIILIFSEAYPTLDGMQPIISNKAPDMEDKENKRANYQWINKVNPKEFQAILPLPYFHIGSENITIGFHDDLSNFVYISSLKTGLPLYAVSASRTSLSQTYLNVSFIKSNTSLPDLPPLTPGKAFLVLCKKGGLDEEELLLYNECTLLFKTDQYEILKLYPEAIRNVYQKRRSKILEEEKNKNNSNSTNQLIRVSFDDYPNQYTFKGNGALEFGVDEEKIIHKSILPLSDSSKSYIISFWLFNFKKDLYPRSLIKYILTDSMGNNYYSDIITPLRIYKQFHHEWALLELPFQTMNYNDSLTVMIYNNDLRPGNRILIDELMIRPYYLDVYQKDSLYISKNNRYYLLTDKDTTSTE